MRKLSVEERTQRGCSYCADAIPATNDGSTCRHNRCPYDECPYHELDDVKTYTEYMKKTNWDGLLKALEALG